jgi:hypothetical protein
LIVAFFAYAAAWSQPITVECSINMTAPLTTISPDLFGIFFEEINHAGHCGLYQQRIDNGDFETNFKTYAPWNITTGQSLELDYSMPLNDKQPCRYLSKLASHTRQSRILGISVRKGTSIL